MSMNFEFATATRIIFGAGAINQVGQSVKHIGRRALVVTGGNPGRAEKLLANLSANGVDAAVFSVTSEPEISTVENGVAFAKKENCNFVISIGGGSVIDAGKAIAAMMANEGALLDYLEIIGAGNPLARRSATFIAIPTTAGTGAEVTRNAVLASPEHKVKVSLRSPRMIPSVAVIDPELTYDLPAALTATTGLDALTQLIEPFVCLRANLMTDGFCVEGIQRVARSLREAVFNGQNKSAREDMAVASLFGGLALANAGLGAVHGFAGPIGGSFPVSHGAICAALLPHVMAANLRALRKRQPDSFARQRYYRVATLLTGNPHATADAGVEWVQKLVAELPVSKLREYGLREENIADLATKAAKASSMKANPIMLTPDELAETLRLAL
jgi:alcohol dehydrogenase class IV